MKSFARVVQTNVKRDEVNLDNILSVIKEHKPIKSPSPVMQFAGTVSYLRAFLFGLMTGNNNGEINEVEFLSGCTRFGIDNPTPIITKRIAWYGNTEDLEKVLERAAEKNGAVIDPAVHGGIEFDTGNKYKIMGLGDSATKLGQNLRDLEETEELKPRMRGKKTCVADIKLLSNNAHAGIKKFSNPAEAILAKGIKIKIKDINKNDRSRAKDKQIKFTSVEVGVHGDKQILVPSFGTTSTLFARHFDILRSLKRRIDLLKQAYEHQLDEGKSWDQVSQILQVLEKGCQFLTIEDVMKQSTSEDPTSTRQTPLLYEDPALTDDERRFKEDLRQRELEEEERLLSQARKESTKALLDQRRHNNKKGDGTSMSGDPSQQSVTPISVRN